MNSKRSSSSPRAKLTVAAWPALVLSLLGCGANVPPPTEAYAAYAQAQGQAADLPALTEGHRQYVLQCSGCHGLRRPSKIAPGEWPKWVKDMAQRPDAQLTRLPEIEQYLVIASGYLRDSVAQAKAAKP